MATSGMPSTPTELPSPDGAAQAPAEDPASNEQRLTSDQPPTSNGHQESQRLLPAPEVASPAQLPSLKGRRGCASLLKAWWFELLSLLLAVGALAAVTTILAIFNQKEQPSWKYSINLNTLIAILATLLRVCLTVGVEEAVSQAKWLWFRRPRPLRHVAHFDAAARSPWGSILLPFRIRSFDSILVGCLVIILSIGIGPFTQQAIQAVPCTMPLTLSDASIQIARIMPSTNLPSDAGDSYDLDLGTKAAIFQGVANPNGNRSAIDADCPTGNCTFPQRDGVTHYSVGICSKCVDVTRWVSEVQNDSRYVSAEKGNDHFLFLPTASSIHRVAGIPFNTSWPLGMTVGGITTYQNGTALKYQEVPDNFFNATARYNPEIYSLKLNSSADNGPFDRSVLKAWNASDNEISIMTLTYHGCELEPGGFASCPHRSNLNLSKRWDPYNVVAANCVFYPCEKSYHAVVNDTVLTETLVSETPLERLYGWEEAEHPNFTEIASPCIVDGQEYTFANVSDLDAQDKSRALRVNISEDQSVWVPYECYYGIDGRFLHTLDLFLRPMFTGGCRMPMNGIHLYAGPQEWDSVMCDENEAWWLRSLYNKGNATFESIDANMEAVAVSITNKIRRQGTDWNEQALFVKGVASRAAVCTQFNWVWLAFPFTLLLLTISTLVIMSVKSLLDKHEVPVWKASSLPLLFTGNGSAVLGASEHVEGIEADAEQSIVRLVREDGRWEFVSDGMGDLEDRATATGPRVYSASSATMRTASHVAQRNGMKAQIQSQEHR